jgi:hypothetical protein
LTKQIISKNGKKINVIRKFVTTNKKALLFKLNFQQGQRKAWHIPANCYGSYKKPLHPGSKGGGSNGGQGGGVVDINVARYLHPVVFTNSLDVSPVLESV